MKKELEKELLELIKSVNEGKEFVVDQAPDVIQHFIYMQMYYFFILLFSFIVCIVGFCITLGLLNRRPFDKGVEDLTLILFVIFVVGIIGTFIGMVIKGSIFFAPKWYVVSYFM